MGKRSSFERVERDFYPTPYEAVVPLLPFLSSRTRFWEPCCGDGALANHLRGHGYVCTGMSDVEPQTEEGIRLDFRQLTKAEMEDWGTTHIITNPPWDRDILHPMIEHFSALRPTWLLFDADWMHTKQSKDLIKKCRTIVSVGRVKWIPDSKMTGKDNCCWYEFVPHNWELTTFVGRT